MIKNKIGIWNKPITAGMYYRIVINDSGRLRLTQLYFRKYPLRLIRVIFKMSIAANDQRTKIKVYIAALGVYK